MLTVCIAFYITWTESIIYDKSHTIQTGFGMQIRYQQMFKSFLSHTENLKKKKQHQNKEQWIIFSTEIIDKHRHKKTTKQNTTIKKTECCSVNAFELGAKFNPQSGTWSCCGIHSNVFVI